MFTIKEEEKLDFYQKLSMYETRYIKEKLNIKYNKINAIIAKNIINSNGYKSENIYKDVYESNEKEFTNYINNFYPSNMMQIINNEDINSKIEIVMALNKKWRKKLVQIYFIGCFLDSNNFNEDTFERDLFLFLNKTSEKYNLININWKEKINNSKIIYI